MKTKAFLSNPIFFLGLLYFLSAKGHLEIIDSAYSVRTSQNILESGTMLIEPIVPEYRHVTPEVNGTDMVYSQYGIGILAIFVPVVALSKCISIPFGLNESNVTHFLLSFYNLPFAILALWHFKNILEALGGSERTSTFLMLCLGVCTIFWKYVVTDFSEITQIALILGALRETLRDSEKKWVGVSTYLAFLVSLKMVYVTLIPFFGLLAMYEGLKKKDIVRNIIHLASLLIPCAAILMIANFVRFRSIMETGYGAPGESFSLEFFERDFLDYIYSLQRGILPFSPLLLMSILMWRRFYRGHPKFAQLVSGITLFWLCLMASYKGVQGGYCWGNRNLLPMVPLLAISWVYVNWNKPKEKYTFILLGIISIPIQIVGVSLKTHEYSILANEINEEGHGFFIPEQLPGSLLLFKEKLTNTSGKYNSNFLTSSCDKIINLKKYKSFIGYNYWIVHCFKVLKFNSMIKPIGIVIIISNILIIIILLRIIHTKHSET